MDKAIKNDCRYFKGDVPCKYHKQFNLKCPCRYYLKRGMRILIIKLGAAGDVIRTTPLLRKLKEIDPACEITWLTYFPEVLPSIIDFPLAFTSANILKLEADTFDYLYNLDKAKEACALANLIKAKVKKGFKLVTGKCAPIDGDAQHKFLTGLNDELNRKNKLSYPEEIFRIVGLPYSKEKYVLDKPTTQLRLPSFKKPVIGLNIGCGIRWRTRLWPDANWIALATKLISRKMSVLLLGGENEDEKNRAIMKKTGAFYPGCYPLKDFIYIVDQCDLVVTTVTMALHIAIGLGKKVVLLNNIFNRNEFELYGLGKIIEPPVDCLGCYKEKCSKRCMEKIGVEQVLAQILSLL